jgi:prepilin-type N-terminal cleavage/methylation domain-containing protein
LIAIFAKKIGKQHGYTLVEVVISAAIGAILMAGLTSVVLTSVRATNVATARIEASSQIRGFQFLAYDDFARSMPPSPGGCSGNPPARCTINLSGLKASNSIPPDIAPFKVTYSWDGGTGYLDRNAVHAAAYVTAFSYDVDQAGQYPTVVVNLTVTIRNGSPNDYYSQSQTMRFYPRVQP